MSLLPTFLQGAPFYTTWYVIASHHPLVAVASVLSEARDPSSSLSLLSLSAASALRQDLHRFSWHVAVSLTGLFASLLSPPELPELPT